MTLFLNRKLFFKFAIRHKALLNGVYLLFLQSGYLKSFNVVLSHISNYFNYTNLFNTFHAI